VFNKDYESRLRDWRDFRESLEECSDPLVTVYNQYDQAPTVSIHTDPYDPTIWPNPWELILENQYCKFCKLLGMCYTLQLTERFSQSSFRIHIAVDKTKSEMYYLLQVDNHYIGYLSRPVVKEELPETLISQECYDLPLKT